MLSTYIEFSIRCVAKSSTKKKISFRILFIFRHPKSIPSNTFLLPFKTTLWYAIVGLTVFSAFIIRNMFSVENHEKVRKSINDERINNEDTYSNSMLMTFGFLLQQSGGKKFVDHYGPSQSLNFCVFRFQAIQETFSLRHLEY